MSSVITTPASEIAEIMDCTEGLENRIKAFSKDNRRVTELIEKVSTKRYTKTRVGIILIANLLKIKESLVRDCLNKPLYIKILAINGHDKNFISLISTRASAPVLTRKSDASMLCKTALDCFNKDVLASDIYGLVTNTKQNEHQMLII